MCLDTTVTWDRCLKVELRHRICLYYIEHTRLQIDTKKCPYLRHQYVQHHSTSCACKLTFRDCTRGTWALPKDGDHSWQFEVDESGHTWSLASSPEKKIKKEELDDSEHERGSRHPAKKIKTERDDHEDWGIGEGSSRRKQGADSWTPNPSKKGVADCYRPSQFRDEDHLIENAKTAKGKGNGKGKHPATADADGDIPM